VVTTFTTLNMKAGAPDQGQETPTAPAEGVKKEIMKRLFRTRWGGLSHVKQKSEHHEKSVCSMKALRTQWVGPFPR
jgi:hypothetical protein